MVATSEQEHWADKGMVESRFDMVNGCQGVLPFIRHKSRIIAY